MTHFNNHIQDDFHFIDECLRKIGVLEIAAFKYDYYRDVIHQFHCTIYIDDEHNMTWMTGSEQVYGTYDELCAALGYGGWLATGYKIHSEDAKAVSNISFCYHTSDCVAEPPAISGMYYSFNALAKLSVRIWFARWGTLLTFVATISTSFIRASHVVRERLMCVISSSVS
jgi:hypothetical protein